MVKKISTLGELNQAKKRSFTVSARVIDRLVDTEMRAKSLGILFPIEEHIEDAIRRIIDKAQSRLDEAESGESLDIVDSLSDLDDSQ